MPAENPLLKKPSVIGIDFDGTCVTHEFPKVGRDIGAVPVLRDLVAAGHQLILWTMRSDGRDDGTTPLKDAVDWFAKYKIPLYGINKNPTQKKWTKSPKAYCNLYIDDAALGIPLVFPSLMKDALEKERPYVSWGEVRYLLQRHGYLPRTDAGKTVE